MNYRYVMAILALCTAQSASAQSGFLTDYSQLEVQQTPTGTDRLYMAPGAFERIVAYSGVMIDQPEIHFSADSEYRGLKPEDVEAIAAVLREALTERLDQGHYRVVEEPGPDVLYMRTALTELYLKKKKRGLMSYTPVGAVVTTGKNALTETMEKVDIIEMTMEAELADSLTGEILGAAVIERGGRKSEGHKEERMDMDEFRGTVAEYAARFRCRLDNARAPEAERIDCLDPSARAAREPAAL